LLGIVGRHRAKVFRGSEESADRCLLFLGKGLNGRFFHGSTPLRLLFQVHLVSP
jgi:hypothetical protein